jgi:hypothetical protein
MSMALGAEEPVAIKPDYWVAFLWKRTLGTAVLNATSSDPLLRAYAFLGRPPSPFSPAPCQASPLQLLLINLSNTTKAQVTLPPAAGGSTFSAWVLSPLGGDPFGTQALVNNVQAPTIIDAAKVDPTTFLQEIIWPPVTGGVADGLGLPPLSTTFLCYGS